MPWTFAHPAAVMPLRRLCPRWLSLPALVLGSLTPDLGYYGGQLEMSSFSHTPLGIVAACLPLGLLLLALLTRFLRPLTVLLPTPHRQLFRAAFQGAGRGAWVEFMIAALSLLIGAASHVLWDAFTHANRWGVALIPLLDQQLFLAGDRQIRVFNLLQHLSTALGLAAIAWVYWRPIRSQATPAASTPNSEVLRKRLLFIGVALSVIVGLLVAFALAAPSQPASTSRFVVRTVVWSTACFALLFLAASLIWWQRRRDD